MLNKTYIVNKSQINSYRILESIFPVCKNQIITNYNSFITNPCFNNNFLRIQIILSKKETILKGYLFTILCLIFVNNTE